MRSLLVKKTTFPSKEATSASVPKPLQLCRDKSIGVTTALCYQLNTDPNSVSKYSLKLIALVNKEKPFVCGECSRCFRTKQAVRQHFIRIHIPLRFKCPECKKNFAYQNILKRHVEREHGNDDSDRKREVKFCKSCSKRFRNEITYNAHLQKHEKMDNKYKYECKICATKNTSMTFTSERQLLVHNNWHRHGYDENAAIFVYPCETCSKTFTKPSSLDAHIRRSHSGNTACYKCDVCEVVYKDMSTLQHHIDYTHLKKRENLCDRCGKFLTTRARLNMHMKTHEKGPVKCDSCNEMFPDRKSFEDHHCDAFKSQNAAWHICQFCPKRFIKRKSLTSHMNRHTMERDNSNAALPAAE